MSSQTGISRRDFLKTTAVAAGTVGLWAGAGGRCLGANDRINVGVIGVGGRGLSLLRVLLDKAPEARVAAVCDVFDKRLERAADLSGATPFRDHGDLLASGVDAVVIATPDHWHRQMTLDALAVGCDVYCEKPMTLHREEARKVAVAVRRTGCVLQVGAQSCSDDRWWQARDQVRAGNLGRLVWSQSGAYRSALGGVSLRVDRDARPGRNLDWDRWLGPAPRVDWDPERFFAFRRYWDYSGGLATDLLYHSLSHLLIAIGPEFPTRVMASGGILAHHDRGVPDTFHALIDYPGGHTVALHATRANQQGLREIVRGDTATLCMDGPDVVLRPERTGRYRDPDVTIRPEPRPDHLQNWLDCIRSRQTPALDAETAYRTQVAIGLAVEAYREQQVKLFDPARERVV